MSKETKQPPPPQILHEGKLWDHVDNDFVTGYVLSHNTIPAGKPTLLMRTPLFPFSEWAKIVAFFKWTQKEFTSEAQVRLYYNRQTREWKAWAFPQKANGMTTKELNPAHEINLYGEEKAVAARWGDTTRLFADPNWVHYGSVHHHCTATAFQSGTDREDENNIDGMHITLGKILDDTMDHHMRFSFMESFYNFTELSEFVEAPPQLALLTKNLEEAYGPKFHNFLPKIPQALLMSCFYEQVEVPEEWKANVYHYEYKAMSTLSFQDGHYEKGVWVPHKKNTDDATKEITRKITDRFPSPLLTTTVDVLTGMGGPDGKNHKIPRTTYYWLRKIIKEELTVPGVNLHLGLPHRHGLPKFLGFVNETDRRPQRLLESEKEYEGIYQNWRSFMQKTEGVPLLFLTLALREARTDQILHRSPEYVSPATNTISPDKELAAANVVPPDSQECYFGS
jgi:hypothetical protein